MINMNLINSMIISITITGCSALPLSSDSSLAESVIAQKVSIAAEAQRDYLALLQEDSRIQRIRNEDFNNELVDVDYIGKPLPILSSMGNRYGFNLVEIGKRKELRIINIRMKNVSPVEVLRSIAQQIDYSANVILDKNSNTIRIVYK